MNDVVVEVNHLWKRFHRGELHDSLRDVVPALVRRLLRRGRRRDQLEQGDFWALRDVSFQVRQGEVLGIIGANGAGKSTLLKILARILRPNRGSIRVNGRLRALIEIAAGFHPDLTGRENIYLNGSILGMKQREIDRKFDEIVGFAGISDALDTPVKRYSSGMYARLGFAVAAHLDPDILVVDEVLAVGDAEFQKKSLGKMEDAAKGGRTVLFVSHNMQAVSSLCPRTMLLQSGQIDCVGDSRQVIEKYLKLGDQGTAEAAWSLDLAPGNDAVRLRRVRVLDARGETAYTHSMDDPITLEVEFQVLRAGCQLTPSFHVYNQQGVCLFAVANLHDPEWGDRCYPPGLYRSSCCIPANYLNEGRHWASVFVVRDKGVRQAHKDQAVFFAVQDFGTRRGGYTGGWIGVVRPLLPWSMERIGDHS